MDHKYSAGLENVRLRPLRKEDIEKVRIWRNDPDISRFLSPIPYITESMQEKWFEKYLLDPDEIIFAIEETDCLNRMVGSLSLYNFKDNEAEIGKIVVGDESAHGMGIGKKAFLAAMALAFERLKISIIKCSVHRENYSARHIYFSIGFQAVGEHDFINGGIEDELQIDKTVFEKENLHYKDMIRVLY